jgi:hypothetical protein
MPPATRNGGGVSANIRHNVLIFFRQYETFYLMLTLLVPCGICIIVTSSHVNVSMHNLRVVYGMYEHL